MQNEADLSAATVKFHLPEDNVDDEESTYLNHATETLLTQTCSSTDEDYSFDRLNSSDFFDAPEAVFSEPQIRGKRISQGKQRVYHKSKSEEKDIKRRHSVSRDLKQQTIREMQEEEGVKKKPSRTETKLRHKSRSMERDDKKKVHVTVAQPYAVKRQDGIEFDPSVPNNKEEAAECEIRQCHGGEGARDSDADRKMFYKQMVLSMQLGKKVCRDREEKGRTCHEKLFPLQRQYSGIIYTGRDRRTYTENLYVALQAHRKLKSVEDYSIWINTCREKIPDRIASINNFQFIQDSPYSYDVCELLSDPFSISDEYLNNVEAAIEQVERVLESIDMILSLYPNSKSLRKDLDMSTWSCVDYQKRISALTMWLNIAEGLITAIKKVGKRIGVAKMSSVQWPFVDPVETAANSSIQSAATISTNNGSVPNSPSDGELDERCLSTAAHLAKKVTFEQGTPLSSSPVSSLQPEPPSDLLPAGSKHMVMSTSFPLFDITSSPTAFYRPVVDKLLRKTSLMGMLKSTLPPVMRPLLKAKYCIVKMEMKDSFVNSKISSPLTKPCEVLALCPDHDIIMLDIKVHQQEALDDTYSSFYKEFTSMKLPSLIPLYVFLARSSLDLMHESLRLRLEQHIETPSLPIVRQVVHECSEAAKAAISVKQSYQYILSPITKKMSISDEVMERYIDRFNSDLKEVLEEYFDYVEYGMKIIRKDTTPSVLKSFLEEEWTFSKEISPYITGGMADAGKRFCGMCSLLLQSIQNQLEQELDRSLFDSNPTIYSPEGLSSPQPDGSTCRVESGEGCDGLVDDICTTADYRQMLMKSCREIKTLFGEMKEWAHKALGFAKLLRKDLEIAAEFKVNIEPQALMTVLEASRHVRVVTAHTANYIIVVPESIRDDRHSLQSLLDVTCGREETVTENTTPAREGYMLLINCGDNFKWTGEILDVEPKTETAIALSHISVDGLFLIVTHSSQLGRQRKAFRTVAADAVELVNEQTTCHLAIAEAWCELRTSAFDLARGVQSAIEHVENQLDSTDLQSLDTNSDRKTIKAAYKETLHQCYSFGFEFLQEFSKLNTSSGQAALQKDQVLLSFAHQWINFVLNKCEQGKGTRPRWANLGFDFLSLVAEPSITKNISDGDFEHLKTQVFKVIQHVIGAANSSNSSPRLQKKGEVFSPHLSSNPYRLLSVESGPTRRQLSSSSNSSRKSVCSDSPTTPYDRTDSFRSRTDSSYSIQSNPSLPEMPSFPADMLPPERVQAAVSLLDRSRDKSLYEKKVIGHVSEGHHSTSIVRINVRRVNFKWQRGTKIGEGQFGVVYSAVNCDTNCMMAMKELRFQPNDVQTIKLIADELKTFEGINHPNLVKYYGIEVHKEEIFIFMEYCAEGTLEEMAKIGLNESIIRRYTRELVIAIEYLHEHNIVHRDIKGANIFLVENNKLKLGDFGCSAKLKEHTTIPGEMVAFVGTAAFMAPEVITQKGHGRAADIWSLGCVVIEMVTGKRPWHEMDNMHQIMFKVGMGNTPPIPENFHQEGKDFLSCCFEVEPANRSAANVLVGHTFLKVSTEEDDYRV